jgi:putative transposase
MIAVLRKVIKCFHRPLHLMLIWTCELWYLAHPLSLRHIEEMTAERLMNGM